MLSTLQWISLRVMARPSPREIQVTLPVWSEPSQGWGNHPTAEDGCSLVRNRKLGVSYTAVTQTWPRSDRHQPQPLQLPLFTSKDRVFVPGGTLCPAVLSWLRISLPFRVARRPFLAWMYLCVCVAVTVMMPFTLKSFHQLHLLLLSPFHPWCDCFASQDYL